MAVTTADTTADLGATALFCAAMANSASRASDTLLRNANVARWMARTQLPAPKADEFVDDLLRDFDRMAVIVERIRAGRRAAA